MGAIDASEGDYSLSMNCTIPNTTVVQVGCGSNVTGSTVGLSRKDHIFCSNDFARVEASTCGSNFDTEISVNSTVLDRQCGDCPSDTNARCIGFNVRCEGEGGKCETASCFWAALFHFCQSSSVAKRVSIVSLTGSLHSHLFYSSSMLGTVSSLAACNRCLLDGLKI